MTHREANKIPKKMTYEEARQCIATYCVEGCADTCDFISTDNCVQALAIKALEKQIPKKPDMWMNGEHLESYECPNCGSIYDFDTDGFIKFCHECGQRIKIDWSEEE